jgi:molecular chaperone GrpE
MENKEMNTEEKNNQEEIVENQNQETTEASHETEHQQDISTEKRLNEEIKALNEKYLRLYSEFDNFRRRTAKEKLELIQNGGSDMIKELLPTVDDFERAIKSNEKVEDAAALKDGFLLIYNKLKKTLESKGLKEMTVVGEAFDSEIHEAITNIPAPTEDMKGKVVDQVEKGYYHNEKVIRFAKVVVGN